MTRRDPRPGPPQPGTPPPDPDPHPMGPTGPRHRAPAAWPLWLAALSPGAVALSGWAGGELLIRWAS